ITFTRARAFVVRRDRDRAVDGDEARPERREPVDRLSNRPQPLGTGDEPVLVHCRAVKSFATAADVDSRPRVHSRQVRGTVPWTCQQPTVIAHRAWNLPHSSAPRSPFWTTKGLSLGHGPSGRVLLVTSEE